MKTKILLFTLFLFFFSSYTATAQWTSLGSGITATPRALAGISPVNKNVVWGFTWDPVSFSPTQEFTRTSDGGQTWHAGTMNGVATDQYLISLFPMDDQTAWLTTADEQNPISGHIYKTTDGGTTWVQQVTGFTGFNETPAGIWFWDDHEGFAYGAPCDDSYNDQIAIYTTDDGGENWTKVTAPDLPAQLTGEGMCIWNLTGFFSVVGDHVWFGTNKGRIFRSTDRGHTWEAYATPFAGSISSVTFRDEQTGLALSQSPFKIARTTDGGQTWSELPGNFPSNYFGSQVEYVPGTRSTWFIVPSSSKYLVSYNDGDSWETFNSNIDAWSVEFLDPQTGFAGSYTLNPITASAFKWTAAPLGNRIFVDDNVSVPGEGASWDDAFNNLQNALAVAKDGDQIWVAEGNYLPGDDPTATFLIDKNLYLYGGFSGTETALSERENPADHPTILSGDLNGDDVEDDFEMNRADNAMTVVTADDSVRVEIDGFTISHGHAPTEEPDETGRGGGLHSKLDNGGSIAVRNCLFTQNFAGRQGGGMFAQNQEDGGEAPFVIENTVFQSNRSGSLGGGIYISQWGDNTTIVVNDCQFDNNVAHDNGGGLGYWSSNTASVNSFLEIDDCSFTQNSTVEFSGSALSVGLWGENTNLVLNNSSFVENGPALFGTAAIWGNGLPASGTAVITNCLFENNHATYSAGLSTGSLPGTGYFTYDITNCDFIGNQASAFGGAMDFYGESPSLMTIEDCLFSGNSAGEEGGAILAVTNHPEFVGRMSNCVLENNSSPAGAAVVANDFTEQPGLTLDADITFENCLMTGNDGENGTVHLYNIGTLKLLNCTLADNSAGGIVQNDNSSITLQNTILSNPDGFIEYIGSTGNTTVTSNGGNLVRDNSMNDHLGELDKPETEPGFEPGTFEPSPTSPLVNSGINEGVMAMYDLAGNDRIQEGTVDIGAYESPYMLVSAREVIVGEVGLSPNPATDFLRLQLSENINQPVEVSLFDPSGKLLSRQRVANEQTVDLEGLAPGMFLVKAVIGERVYTGKFVKQ